MELSDIYKDASAVLISSEFSWFKDEYLTIFQDRPDISLFFKDCNIYIKYQHGDAQTIQKSPFDIIEEFNRKGYYAVGYISYDYLDNTDVNVKLRVKEFSTDLPTIYFGFYGADKIKSISYKQAQKVIGLIHNRAKSKGFTEFKNTMDKDRYISKINAIKSYIEAGDVYQVNLSHMINTEFNASPIELFLKYFRSQPVPYGIYIDCESFHLLGGSMEQFIEKKGDIITTKPIKGTAKRNTNARLDEKIKSGLCNNPKERAENLMIVDLMRNDLSRICKTGTVRVDKLFDVKSYKTLHQMESVIIGQLKEGIKLEDIIHNVFPPGSVTGAPKKRAVEVIDELENHGRGPYCGCAGLFSPNGDFTLCVSIRTAIVNQNSINYWAGSGIVYDSDPENEYNETVLKAQAFLKSIH